MSVRLLDATGSFYPAPTVGMIGSWDRESIGGLVGPQNNVAGSLAWPSANRAIFVPFTISTPFIVSQMGWTNGATASGNVDAGVYAADGVWTRLVSTGSTPQAGTSTIQTASCTATLLQPGAYFMALALDNITGTIVRWAPSIGSVGSAVWAVSQMATAFVLPSTATFAAMTTAYLPQIMVIGPAGAI